MAFILSSLAGLSTLIGTIFVFFTKKRNDKIILIALAFSASIMFFISILDLIPESINFISTKNNKLITIALVFIFTLIGLIISYLLDKFLPDKNNKLYKLSIMSVLTIILHNIPEGIATFITTKTNINMGISLTIAIALHNIPEGISISLPIYYATKSKKKAFFYTLVAALSEPLGAIISFLFLEKYMTVPRLGILFSIIAGIMIYLAIFELLKTSLSYKKKNLTIIWIIIGFIVFMLNFIFF